MLSWLIRAEKWILHPDTRHCPDLSILLEKTHPEEHCGNTENQSPVKIEPYENTIPVNIQTILDAYVSHHPAHLPDWMWR